MKSDMIHAILLENVPKTTSQDSPRTLIRSTRGTEQMEKISGVTGTAFCQFVPRWSAGYYF